MRKVSTEEFFKELAAAEKATNGSCHCRIVNSAYPYTQEFYYLSGSKAKQIFGYCRPAENTYPLWENEYTICTRSKP